MTDKTLDTTDDKVSDETQLDLEKEKVADEKEPETKTADPEISANPSLTLKEEVDENESMKSDKTELVPDEKEKESEKQSNEETLPPKPAKAEDTLLNLDEKETANENATTENQKGTDVEKIDTEVLADEKVSDKVSKGKAEEEKTTPKETVTEKTQQIQNEKITIDPKPNGNNAIKEVIETKSQIEQSIDATKTNLTPEKENSTTRIDASDNNSNSNKNKSLNLPTINLNLNDFLTDFEHIRKDLERIQKFHIDGYFRVIEGIEKSRQSAIKQIKQLYITNRQTIMKKKVLSMKKKGELTLQLFAESEKSIRKINYFINKKIKEAIQLHTLSNGNKIGYDMLSILYNKIVKQRMAGIEFINVSENIHKEIDNIFIKVENVVEDIKQKM